MVDREAEKQLAARHAVGYIQNGMRVGLGSGTTAAYAIRFIGERIRAGELKISGVPTSPASRDLALSSGVPLADSRDGFSLDFTIDGADEATRSGELIKGGGGALLHERIVGSASSRYIVIGDSSKLVDRLGSALLPIEVCPFGWRNALIRIQSLACTPTVRIKEDGSFFVTEEGNYIIDCSFPPEAFLRSAQLSEVIRAVPGVVDHGLFLGMTNLIVIARGDHIEEIPIGRGK